MKKMSFIIVCIAMGVFMAFGQNAASDTTDFEMSAEQGESLALPQDDVAAGNDSTGEPLSGVSDSESAAAEDAGASEAANESSDTKTIISTGEEDSSPAQEHTDILSPVEMNEPTQRTKRRSFSMHTGLVVSATAANNVVSIGDFFKKPGEVPEFVIDLNQLSKSMIKSGMHAGTLLDVDAFFRFTVLEEHTVKFSVTANGDAWANVPKSLLDIAANGNPANISGKTIEGVLNAKANVFADMGVMYELRKPRYGFSARLAYFAPIAYMENPEGKYSLSPHITGGIVDGIILKAEGTANIYGALPDYFENKKLSIPEILKNGGLDLTLTGMYRPTNWVAVTGGVSYLPLMPVVTTKGMRASFEYEASVKNLLGSSSGGDGSSPFKQTITREPTSGTLPQKKIMRPLKINIGADFKPFQNDYLILSPFFAFPVLNAKPYYVDGGLKIESRFAKVLGVYLDTRCIERIWRHELCFFIDSRWFTFNLAASVASQDFKRTFTTLSGAGLKLGIGIGF